MLASVKRTIGRWLAHYLSKKLPHYQPFAVHDVSVLESTLQPADVLLVEGNTRISTTIKYLTQSTWSHATLYIGGLADQFNDGEPCALIEADLRQGVIAVPLSKYRHFNTRICRAIDLAPADRSALLKFMIDSLGKAYDLKNVFDLARFLLPQPPVPIHLRRRLLALGSGDPSRAICSTLIAQGFQTVGYPILPEIVKTTTIERYGYSVNEIMRIRHHSLFTPRDFDISPYFQIIKPTVESGFDYRQVVWQETDPTTGRCAV